jgi:hypothetical protein
MLLTEIPSKGCNNVQIFRIGSNTVMQFRRQGDSCEVVPFSFGENNLISYESYGVYIYLFGLPKLANHCQPTPTNANQRGRVTTCRYITHTCYVTHARYITTVRWMKYWVSVTIGVQPYNNN